MINSPGVERLSLQRRWICTLCGQRERSTSNHFLAFCLSRLFGQSTCAVKTPASASADSITIMASPWNVSDGSYTKSLSDFSTLMPLSSVTRVTFFSPRTDIFCLAVVYLGSTGLLLSNNSTQNISTRTSTHDSTTKSCDSVGWTTFTTLPNSARRDSYDGGTDTQPSSTWTLVGWRLQLFT